ncbi:hypothetical protein SBF1_1580009 [Candidatus Desulfosporosinus infrequens]|uniref:Translation elongation factor EFG/EF2 domain-containing protein n=1 Tax=Candidatus Desulfosporosinus infrequens TaxID=2043169 RepID=A0A2U3K8C6_9FIRM|nr:hypothetical protein SBF1_1580009 [Candidatus Desulfosporosinus infrequens]
MNHCSIMQRSTCYSRRVSREVVCSLRQNAVRISLSKSWQRLILTHLEEKDHKGVLTGSAITDLKITLVSGRAHNKHTEGGDFREATYRAVRQGLKEAKPILLEPFHMHVESCLQKKDDLVGDTAPNQVSFTEERWISLEEIDQIINNTFYANKGKKSAWKRRKTALESYYEPATYVISQKEPGEEYLLVDGYNIIMPGLS